MDYNVAEVTFNALVKEHPELLNGVSRNGERITKQPVSLRLPTRLIERVVGLVGDGAKRGDLAKMYERVIETGLVKLENK